MHEKSATREVKALKLKGVLARWFGEIEKYEYLMLLRGDKGAGKSSFLFQIADFFAGNGMNVGFFSLEMDKESKLIKEDYRKRNIKPANEKRILVASELPEGLKTIQKAAEAFDVILIDSWQKVTGAKQQDIDRLRKAHKETIFIVITQSNTAGTTRGGNMADFDASAVAHVYEGGMATFEKNRYASEPGLVYSVFEGKIVDAED
ncbi:hypothetical protein FUAX_50900 (plasmid) [Fulvitalea axinellae]|uniref:AAA+ ATPase domain-containing protein n=1 Tax=Fulvitalea axinellae TaxID=1182444 RepID=A0AAU9CR82_9BACT|nr:hypothetical protein FUAX_50900 [Fulvitalea axinellae]